MCYHTVNKKMKRTEPCVFTKKRMGESRRMDQYVVIDLEMCKVPKRNRRSYRRKNEIIEIGASLLDDDFQIISEFKSFVCPKYGEIDTYIENLTGIKTSVVADAPFFEDAVAAFLEWLPENAVMTAWSDNDAHQLKVEAAAKGISNERLDRLIEEYVDCQAIFSEKMENVRAYSLSDALNIAGIDYSDGAHDALVDAHNTALLFKKLMSEETFTVSPYLSQGGEDRLSYCPFADFLSGANTAP